MNTVTTTSTSEPAIYVSLEFSDDYVDYEGTGSWKWVAKRSWHCRGAIRTEILEVPQTAEGADREDVISMIQALIGTSAGTEVKYAVSQASEEQKYVAIRIN